VTELLSAYLNPQLAEFFKNISKGK